MDQARANRYLLRPLLLIIALVTSTACASKFEQRFDEAERLRAEAAAAGSEWLQTGSLLQQAQEAAANDDLDTAMRLVEQARFQAEMAIRQAAHEADAWADRVVK